MCLIEVLTLRIREKLIVDRCVHEGREATTGEAEAMIFKPSRRTKKEIRDAPFLERELARF